VVAVVLVLAAVAVLEDLYMNLKFSYKQAAIL
jgi:hypothetical protein